MASPKDLVTPITVLVSAVLQRS